jgi:hypothetical protein
MKFKRPIVVCGDVAYVPLTQGKTAIIDSRDAPLVEGTNWRALRRPKGLWYAGTRDDLLMHRLILQPPAGLDTDHVNHNGLDNRRANLRACTRSQNVANGRQMVVSSSQFRGVYWDARCSKWKATITKNGKSVHLRRFATEVEAARAYDDAALKIYGEFAMPNFPRTQTKATA